MLLDGVDDLPSLRRRRTSACSSESTKTLHAHAHSIDADVSTHLQPIARRGLGTHFDSRRNRLQIDREFARNGVEDVQLCRVQIARCAAAERKSGATMLAQRRARRSPNLPHDLGDVAIDQLGGGISQREQVAEAAAIGAERHVHVFEQRRASPAAHACCSAIGCGRSRYAVL